MLFITVQPDGSITEHEVESASEVYPTLKAACEGWIEPVEYHETLTHYHNEEFIYAEGEVFQELNFVPSFFGYPGRIYGPVIYTGGVDEEGETRGLSQASAAAIRSSAECVRLTLDTLRALNPALPKPEPRVSVTSW
ncbi:hypothetical protein SEA_CECE_332 [Microbacterium phage Cece]|nr:hypothetical protein SEA_CECE_30 [Microbacterium phage Cece]UVG35338.1 hypothetical protein SEA_CECE_332 [Microbacterium phage Cece]